MTQNQMEVNFQRHWEVIQRLQSALQSTVFDAYIEHMENVAEGFQVRVIDGVPDKETTEALKMHYQVLSEMTLEPSDWRQLSQLLLLKVTQIEPIQSNHQLTPDGIGFLFVYLIEQLYAKKEKITVLDITVGMGNLLYTILTNLKLANIEANGIGVDNDETLLNIAAITSQLTESQTTLFHQDALQDLLVDPLDVAVGDLPVGYYPIDERAMKFETSTQEGHSYAHHLLMEQAMKYVVSGGFGIFLLPSNFLETEQSIELKKWLGTTVYLQGIIQLPDELFKNSHSRKSIVILQNKGEEIKQAPEVLLAQLTTLKDPNKIVTFFKEFEQWKQENL